MKTNTKPETLRTHEGAVAQRINPELQLRRSVMACLLWEDTFYEDGESIAERIKSTIPLVEPEKVAKIAVEARMEMKLRHVPLLIAREMARLKNHKLLVEDTLPKIIQRADELAEFLSIYWNDGRQPLSAQVKKGLAIAFRKFSDYELAKYDRDGKVKLRDVLFLCHANPKDEEQANTWKQLVNGTLKPPDTWEVALSTGQDKKSTWERLIKENKLGGLAMLRNLRNMESSSVATELVKAGIRNANYSRVLPFRFISAAKAAPKFEDEIDNAMLISLSQKEKLKGKTVVVIDVSGSMYGGRVSRRSDMDRALAACALGAITRELCEEPAIYATAGNDCARIHQTELVPNRRGMSLVDAIYGLCNPLGGGGIFLNQVCNYIKEKEGEAGRTIVITDEQDCAIGDADSPSKANPLGRGYLINVNTYKNGIGYGKWLHIDGWSESVIDYIIESERMNATQT